MATYTPVYGFEKPEGDENYSVSVFNDNMDKAENALNQAAKSADLAKVATTGAYSDLSGVPGAASTTVSGLMSKEDKARLDGVATVISELATVAISGSYNDLSNKPNVGNVPLKSAQHGVITGTPGDHDGNTHTLNIPINAVNPAKCVYIVQPTSSVTDNPNGLVYADITTYINLTANNLEVRYMRSKWKTGWGANNEFKATYLIIEFP